MSQATTIIFGDVHGESTKLRALIGEARARWGDCSFYGVGDYIDRGPDSKGVIQTCVDEGVQGILGNHELWFHQLLHTGEFDNGVLHPAMGGRATLESYKLGARWPQKNVRRQVPESHKEFILGLPPYRAVEVAGTTYWLLHAGIGSAVGDVICNDLQGHCGKHGLTLTDDVVVEVITQAVPDEFLWTHYNANNPQMLTLPGGGVQVMGHTPMLTPRDGGHFIALDTGCGRKRSTVKRPANLSAVALHPEGGRTLFSAGT